MLEQLQLVTSVCQERGRMEGLRWLVSADMNTCGVKSTGSTQWLQLYLLLASGKWQNPLGFSTVQVQASLRCAVTPTQWLLPAPLFFFLVPSRLYTLQLSCSA